jgi:hypothetical protein
VTEYVIGSQSRRQNPQFYAEIAAMLFYCGYAWFSNTRPEEVWERVVHQHERGSNAPELIRGWYDFAGGGSGFLIVETDDVRELTSMLRPYIDLMSLDIRPLSENKYDETIDQIRLALAQMGRLTHSDASAPVGVES